MRVSQKNQNKLLEGLKNGSYQDFNELYELYSDLLYGFALSLIKSPSGAKDIVQETFLKLWKNRKDITFNTSFKSYLYTIAKNLFIDSLREKIENVDFRNFICSEAFLEYSENEVEKTLNFDEFLTLVDKAKNKLSHRQKEIFELSRERGLSIGKIALLLNISEKSVKNQLSLALHTLRDNLSDHYYILFIVSCNILK